MLKKLIIYKTEKYTYTLAKNQDDRLEYYLIDEIDDLTHSIFYGKVIQLQAQNGLVWVNYVGDKIGVLNLSQGQNLQCGSSILCQMNWAGDGNKKAKLNGEIKLSGKYAILLNFKKHYFAKDLTSSIKLEAISQKYLKYGVIFRSAINNLLDLNLLEKEIEQLITKYELLINRINTIKAPQQLVTAVPKYIQLLKNLSYTDDLEIITNDELVFNELRPLIDLWQIDQINLDTKLVIDELSNDITSSTSGITVHKLSGINLIDVDNKNVNLSFFKINYLAIEEIVQSIKFSDLTGLILIDFIKNMNFKQQQELSAKLKLLLNDDWRKNTILGFTKAGICEIIRSK